MSLQEELDLAVRAITRKDAVAQISAESAQGRMIKRTDETLCFAIAIAVERDLLSKVALQNAIYATADVLEEVGIANLISTVFITFYARNDAASFERIVTMQLLTNGSDLIQRDISNANWYVDELS
jgi:hypothetical protein